MGQTIKNLSTKETSQRTIFNHRFVVEVCEQVHVHYRNLRILMSLHDFKEMAKGMSDALKRWEQRGCPETKEGTHIELCRKEVAKQPVDDGNIKVNLNKNLYPKHDGKVFAEGAGFDEPLYIHLKIRELRLELSLDEFDQLAEAVIEAKKNLGAPIES